MPKIKNLAALAAAVEAGRRYARNNPEKAGKYVDQAAAFVDKQTKGKYSGQISGVAGKVKSVAGLPRTATQGFEANAGYGRHEGYGRPASATPPVTPSTTTPSPGPGAAATAPSSTTPTVKTPSAKTPTVKTPPAATPPTNTTVDPERTGEHHFPGSRDV